MLPVHAQEEKTIKRKVAIGRFSNETQYGKGLFYDKENDPMRKQAMDILSSKLAASGKFILLERDDLDILVSEAGDAMDKINAEEDEDNIISFEKVSKKLSSKRISSHFKRKKSKSLIKN